MDKRQELQVLLDQAVQEGMTSLRLDGMSEWLQLGYGCARARFVQCQEFSVNNGNLITVEPNITVEQFCQRIPENIIDVVKHILESELNGTTREYYDY